MTGGVPTLLAVAKAGNDAFVDRLRALVGIDRGSRDLDGLAAAATAFAGFLAEAGMAVTRVPVGAGGPLGDAVVGRLQGSGRAGSGRRSVLLAGHLDTVFPRGTAAARPFTVDAAGIARGPGVCDDAGGLLAGVAAVEVLRELGHDGFGEVVFLATPDEEIGSPGSRALLAELGAAADAVLGLECARADGALVSGRKGVADVAVTLRGRAAHAGIEPGAGASAALAAARLALAFDALNAGDVTVNTGVLRAGERANVVAASGELRAEVRARDPAGFAAALARMRALAAESAVPAELAVEAPVPPWRPTAGTHRLLALAREVGAEVGVDVRAVETGGCGDANLLARHCAAVL
ncbi:MAG TPA: M20/M25/M40 family metallo-hydrolase, partial [Pseudonocardia sp.]